MIVAMALLCGVEDPWLLTAMGSLQSLLMVISGLCEPTCPWQIFVVNTVVYAVVVWGPMFDYLSNANPPAFVWVIVMGLYCVFATFGVVYGLHNVFGVITNPEPAYISLGITSKLTLQWTIYGGVVQNGDGGAVSAILISVILLGIGWFVHVRATLK